MDKLRFDSSDYSVVVKNGDPAERVVVGEFIELGDRAR